MRNGSGAIALSLFVIAGSACDAAIQGLQDGTAALHPLGCLGVRPSQAAKWRPDWNRPGSTVSARLSAPTGPMPGTSASSGLTGLALCCCFIRRSNSKIPAANAARFGELGHLPAQERQHLLGRVSGTPPRPPRLRAVPVAGWCPWPPRPRTRRRGRARHGPAASAAAPATRAPKADRLGLLLGRPHRHARHPWPRRCLADRFRVVAAVLAAPDKRLDAVRRDQLRHMAKRPKLAPPMVRAAARLHLGPPHGAAQDGFLVVVHAMQREHSLGRAKANALKVHADGPSGSDGDNQTLAQDAVGPSTPTMTALRGRRQDGPNAIALETTGCWLAWRLYNRQSHQYRHSGNTQQIRRRIAGARPGNPLQGRFWTPRF